MNVTTRTVGRASRGFTLMEVLIVVTIVGILAAIAIPNYAAYIQRGHRNDAKAMLMSAAQWQQRIRTETNNFSAVLPNGMQQTPPPLAAARYTIAAAVVGATFTITATRAGAQAADECGNFIINELGVRNLASNAAGTTIEGCWGR